MRKGFFGALVTTVFVLFVSQTAFGQESASDPDRPRSYAAALGAHHICSGTLVVGRDYERTPAEVVAQDLAPFPAFGWAADFEYNVDMTSGLVTVSAPDIPDRHAKYTGDQGCVLLPVRDRDVSSVPVDGGVVGRIRDHLVEAQQQIIDAVSVLLEGRFHPLTLGNFVF